MTFKITIGFYICGFCALIIGAAVLKHPIDKQYREIRQKTERSFAGLHSSGKKVDQTPELKDLNNKIERWNQKIYLKTQYHHPVHLESDPGRTKMLHEQNLLLQKMEREIMQDLKQLSISRSMIVQHTQP